MVWCAPPERRDTTGVSCEIQLYEAPARSPIRGHKVPEPLLLQTRYLRQSSGRAIRIDGGRVREVTADPFAPATAAGIHRLAIPTPFAVGRVNVYLIEDEPLTLVDAGPNSGSSLDELQRQLAAHGHRIEDIGLVILTHQHIDHLGLVGIVAAHSGAEVAAIDAAVQFVEHYSAEATADDEFSTQIMLRHGIPGDVVDA